MSLLTMTEESTPQAAEPQFLCALFDFNTFVLTSQVLTLQQLQEKKRHLPLNHHVTNHAVQEYANISNHTTTTLITLSRQVLKRLKYVKIPCLAKKTSIYIRKFKDKQSNRYFIQLSTVKVATPQSINMTDINIESNPKTQIIPYTFGGMVFAIIYSTFSSQKGFIVNGIYYHGHNTNTYKPNFNRREKDSRISKPFDIYIPTENNTIHSLRELKLKKKMKKKSETISDANVANCDGTNSRRRRKKLNTNKKEDGSREEINIDFQLQAYARHSRSVSWSSVSSLPAINAPLTALNES